jgi:hypothetical protein
MHSIAFDSTEMEETIMHVKQLASMALALAVAMHSRSYEARVYHDAVQLLANLIGKHAESLEKMLDAAWPKGETPNTSAREGSM